MENYLERFNELLKEKTYRACLEFEDLLLRACSCYTYMSEALGYPDLVNLYFKIYYGCTFELYYQNENIDWELISIDDHFVHIEKNTYDGDELISSEVIKYPKLFFNNVQYNKWLKWAKRVSYERLLKEKDKLLGDIKNLYTRYKQVEKSIEFISS